jgi:predicted anti-sigma-YlaC factor YlaD
MGLMISMKKSHSYIQKRFLLFLDQELTEKEQTLVSRHLDQCCECRTLFNRFKVVYIAETTEQLKPAPFLWTRIESRLQTKVRREHTQPRLNILRPAAAVFIVVLCFYFGHFLGSFQSSLVPASAGLSEEETVYQSFGMKATEPFADYTMAGAVNAVYNGQ